MLQIHIKLIWPKLQFTKTYARDQYNSSGDLASTEDKVLKTSGRNDELCVSKAVSLHFFDGKELTNAVFKDLKVKRLCKFCQPSERGKIFDFRAKVLLYKLSSSPTYTYLDGWDPEILNLLQLF